jgi:DNA-binding transcriptional MerR regulator
MAASRTGTKSAAAFRTISEVAKELDLPQHVLRFWETRFPSVKPLKRGGGRRYYRPEDIELLRRIRDLLYRDGYTIKGVQRLLREGHGKLPESTGAAPAKTAEKGEGRAAGDATKAELEAIVSELTEIRDLLRKTRR